MNARPLLLLLVAAALTAPLPAAAATALFQAQSVANEPVNFDGGKIRPEGDLVRPGAPTDRRTAPQIAKDEQSKADARAQASITTITPGEDTEIAPPKSNKWLKSEHLINGVKGAMVGVLIGSLWGLTGLGIGALIGGLFAYGLSRIMA
ncbi:MAG: hypothetical protein COV48_07150 [Elusimicrobia bacterium CG11_big_fil_rev_8_21_14_0_20_64_6]|nr:MAG: hypothetical protein COV48_07150 [Elusimicrobia bacterium CG11_big_fil_rev_8_21_14_0_20_64_6]